MQKALLEDAFCTSRWYLIISESLEMDTDGSGKREEKAKFCIFFAKEILKQSNGRFESDD